jgi:hypothetical protein
MYKKELKAGGGGGRNASVIYRISSTVQIAVVEKNIQDTTRSRLYLSLPMC